MNVKEYQLSTLNARNKKLAARWQRKSTINNKMLLRKGNIVAVREKLSQLGDLFKIIEDTQKQMIALDAAICSYDKLDEGMKVFSIKHKA